MYLLADCNKFYCSAEAFDQPNLLREPVIVFSNNDGCAISINSFAGFFGIKMGNPRDQIMHVIRQNNIHMFSSNYEKYADLSRRVMTIFSWFVEKMECYSIDEAFLSLKGYEHLGLKEYATKIIRTATKGTGIPISGGVGPTKVLAKIANRLAKKDKSYNGMCVLDTQEKITKALVKTEIGDVWGIGRQYADFLNNYGIITAYDFIQKPRLWVRANLTVVGEKLYRELLGEECIDLEEFEVPKKAISISRGFGETTSDYNDVSEALALYTSICAEKLRKQTSCTGSMQVYVHTNQHIESDIQYWKNYVVKLPVSTNDTGELIHYAKLALDKIFVLGIKLQKVGVVLTDIVPEDSVQLNFFDTVDRPKRRRVMAVVDKYNFGFAERGLTSAAEGTKNSKGKQRTGLKQRYLSKRCTTRVNELIRVNCRTKNVLS